MTSTCVLINCVNNHFPSLHTFFSPTSEAFLLFTSSSSSSGHTSFFTLFGPRSRGVALAIPPATPTTSNAHLVRVIWKTLLPHARQLSGGDATDASDAKTSAKGKIAQWALVKIVYTCTFGASCAPFLPVPTWPERTHAHTRGFFFSFFFYNILCIHSIGYTHSIKANTKCTLKRKEKKKKESMKNMSKVYTICIATRHF